MKTGRCILAILLIVMFSGCGLILKSPAQRRVDEFFDVSGDYLAEKNLLGIWDLSKTERFQICLESAGTTKPDSNALKALPDSCIDAPLRFKALTKPHQSIQKFINNRPGKGGIRCTLALVSSRKFLILCYWTNVTGWQITKSLLLQGQWEAKGSGKVKLFFEDGTTGEVDLNMAKNVFTEFDKDLKKSNPPKQYNLLRRGI